MRGAGRGRRNAAVLHHGLRRRRVLRADEGHCRLAAGAGDRRARALAAAEMLAELQHAPRRRTASRRCRCGRSSTAGSGCTRPCPRSCTTASASCTSGSPPRVPAQIAPTILHGDYRIGNMQFDGERLAAIIDWEIWSLGDPRTDLAWLLTWLDPVQRFYEQRSAADERAAEGLPTRAEMLADLRRRAARPAVVRGLLPLQDGLDHGGAGQAEPASRDAGCRSSRSRRRRCQRSSPAASRSWIRDR